MNFTARLKGFGDKRQDVPVEVDTFAKLHDYLLDEYYWADEGVIVREAKHGNEWLWESPFKLLEEEP